MANKTQEGLLQEVVGLLRKQNQLSTRDRLRESEEAKRAEKLAVNSDESIGMQGAAIDGATDFQRRFLAGQAGALTTDSRKDTPKGPVQRAILKSSERIANYLENSNDMAKAWRAQDQRDKAEDKRERPPSPLVVAGRATSSYLKKEKDEGFLADMWDKAKWTVFLATAVATLAAYEGMHLWHTKALKGLKVVGKWAGSFGELGVLATEFKTKVLKWFGYDKHGKPIEKVKNFKAGTILNIAGLQTIIGNQLAALKAKAYRAVGLGVDGKKLGNTFKGSPGSIKPGMAGGFGSGFFKTLTGKIGSILSPLIRIGSAITAWTLGTSGKMVTSGLKSLGGTLMKFPGVKLIGKLLWPVTLLFSIFEGFKKGSEEAEKESSTWYTILGEGTGGVLGYIFGGLADLVKNGAVWLITKGLGLKTDENGKILGDGMGVKALNAIKEFSFMDLISDMIAAPFHLISKIVGFVGKLFTDADYRAGIWDWVSELPNRLSQWMKGLMPKWMRDAFGIEYEDFDATSLNQKRVQKSYGEMLKEKYKYTNPVTEAPWTHPRNKKRYIAQQQALFNDSPDLQQQYKFDAEQKILLAAIAKQTSIERAQAQYKPGDNITHIQVINYEAGGYGNYLREAFAR